MNPTPLYEKLKESYLTVSEAAALIRIHPRCVYTMAEVGRIRSARVDPKRLGLRGRITQKVVLVLRADVERIAKAAEDRKARWEAGLCPKGHVRRSEWHCLECKAIRRRKAGIPIAHRWTDADTDLLKQLRADGMSRSLIYGVMGFSYHTVSENCRKLGI